MKTVSEVADELIRSGVAAAGIVLKPTQIEMARSAWAQLSSQSQVPYSEYAKADRNNTTYLRGKLYGTADWQVSVDAAGASPTLDALLEEVLTSSLVQGVLHELMGSGYKCVAFNIRHALRHSVGQPLHQDASATIGMQILVNDVAPGDGATAFLPRSHRWPIHYSDVGVSLQPHALRPLLRSASGKAGSVFFYFHRTWHGRFPSTQPATAIFTSFVPVGYVTELHPTPSDVLASFGPELRRVLDFSTDVEWMHGGKGRLHRPDGAPAIRTAIRDVYEDKISYPLVSPWQLLVLMAQFKRRVSRMPVARALRDALISRNN